MSHGGGSKVVFLVANSPFTLLNFRLALMRKLVAIGHSVVAVCPRQNGFDDGFNAESEFASVGVKFEELPMTRAGKNVISELGVLIKLTRLVRQYRPAKVLNYTIKPTIYSSLVAKIFSSADIFSNITGLGTIFVSDSRGSRLLRRLLLPFYRLALGFNTRVFFQNADDEQCFVNLGLISPANTVLLPGSGVDTELFQCERNSAASLTFIFVGRLIREKGIVEFLEVARRIVQKYSDVRFLIAGAIDDNPSSLSKHDVSSYARHDRIEFLGHVRDVKPLYERASVFVLPSYREGTPRSGLEAMSMGLPIITTDAPGCREIVLPGVNGVCVPVRSVDQLFSAMEQFVCDSSLLESMGENSRRMAVERFDEKIVLRSVIDTIFW